MVSRRARWVATVVWALSFAGFAFGCGRDIDPWEEEERESGDRVVAVHDLGEGCFRVEYEVKPSWECSAEQIELAKASPDAGVGLDGYDGYDGGSPGTNLPFDEVKDLPADLAAKSCATFVDARRRATVSATQAQIEGGFRTRLRSCLPTQRFEFFLDGEKVATPCGYSGDDGAASGGSTSSGGWLDGGDPGGEGDDGASEYSETNNQVAGVEEADYVKNDAGYIFLLTTSGLEIFDSWPVEQTKRLTTVTFEAEPRRLLLAGDRLVVFLRTMTSSEEGVTRINPSNQGCTYGYDCRFTSEGGSTEVRVYDVSTPATPRFLTQYELSGGYVASRRIGDDVHVVVHDRSAPPDWIGDLQWNNVSDVDELTSEKARLERSAEKSIGALDDAVFLPRFAGDRTTAPCEEFLEAPAATGNDLVTLASFNLKDLDALHRTTLATAPGYVHVSAKNLYLVTDGVGGGGAQRWGASAANDASVVHKFTLDGGSKYRGSAVVRGHVLNQFSMDERDDILRVATTSGWVPDAGVSSSVTTFRQTSGGFRRYGELTGLAPTEDIRSVRFDGDRGFVVTFKKTDPLFVFGLSDPARPTVLGELKIPGFSTYMHPLDRDHLLAVGYDADDHGSFAYFDGIQVQIFDVSDLSRPTLLHKKVIGTRGSSSEALLNHLAFNYFAPQKVLALPITICEGGDVGTFGSTMSFTGVLALDIDLVVGITERGRLPFASPDSNYNPEYENYGQDGCFQWWSLAASNVQRTIFLEDYVFGISDAELRAGHLDSLSDVLVSLPIGRSVN